MWGKTSHPDSRWRANHRVQAGLRWALLALGLVLGLMVVFAPWARAVGS